MAAPPGNRPHASDDEAWPGWRKLSPLEVLMSRSNSPNQPMVISAMFGFESILSDGWVHDVFASRLAYHPRFRSTLRPSFTGQHFAYLPSCEKPGRVPPGVVHVEAPADSGASASERSATFRQRVNELASHPMRVDRPLWAVHYFPGYATDKPEKTDAGTILLRVHHCVGDGVGLVKYCFKFVADAKGDLDRAKPPPFRRECEAAEKLSFWSDPLSFFKQGLLFARQVYETYGGVVVSDAKSIYNSGALGKEKFMEFSPQLPLSDVKAVAKSLGFTVNTVFSACVTAALRGYLLRHGNCDQLPDPKRFHAALAFNMHSAGPSTTSLSNKVALVPVELHISVSDPDVRMELTANDMHELKAGMRPVLVATAFKILMLLPDKLRRPLWYHMTRRASVVWTNVPGPQEKSLIDGKRIDSIGVAAPTDGDCGLVFTMFSYANQCSLGSFKASASRRLQATATEPLLWSPSTTKELLSVVSFS